MADKNVFDTNAEFTAPEIDVSEVTSETLVGEGRKYKSTDELAKAYAHADAYVAQAKAEQATKSAEIKVLKDLLEANQNKTEEKPPEVKTPEELAEELRNKPPEVPNSKNEDLSTRINERLDEVEREREFSGNVNKVSETLTEHFGSPAKAQDYVSSKAKELGVPTDWLMDVAGKSTTAFYNTVGFSPEAGQSNSSPNSGPTVNTAAFRNNNAGVRNNAYYEEIRKTDPKLYYSAPTQRSLMNDAREQGADFFKT